MKIGIVKHLNARPLTYGFEKSGKHSVFSESPAILRNMLLDGELDTALISSVEVLRNRNSLSFCGQFGVCANKKVRSILFYKNKTEPFPPEKIFVDSGSRSSVALLKLLLKMETGKDVDMIPVDPSEIRQMLFQKSGSHLLFGDNALTTNLPEDFFDSIDLATWWNLKSGLSFCFALWAFPKTKNLPDDFFRESLEYGTKNLDEIISQEKRFPPSMVSEYLKNELHFLLNQSDRDGFSLFEKKCIEFGYL